MLYDNLTLLKSKIKEDLDYVVYLSKKYKDYKISVLSRESMGFVSLDRISKLEDIMLCYEPSINTVQCQIRIGLTKNEIISNASDIALNFVYIYHTDRNEIEKLVTVESGFMIFARPKDYISHLEQMKYEIAKELQSKGYDVTLISLVNV